MRLADSIKHSGERAYKLGEEYLDKTQELYSLKILSYFTSFISEVVNNTLVIVALLISFFFFSIAGFVVLAEHFDSYVIASICIGICYLIIAILIHIMRHRIDNFLVFKISQKINDHESI